MKQIERYKVTDPEDIQSAIGYHRVDLPKGADILDVSISSYGCIYIHALVNRKHKEKARWFAVYKEGHELTEYDKKHYEYVGYVKPYYTVCLNEHVADIYHIFEVHE